MRRLAAALFLFLFLQHLAFAQPGNVIVCVDHIDQVDWNAGWSNGAIIIPNGTVFDYAGHILGGDLQDPKDLKHSTGTGWSGISASENDRRTNLIQQDLAINPKSTSGLITTEPLTLSKSKPCGLVRGAALLSAGWGWTVSPIYADRELYFEVYGVVEQGQLNTDFSSESAFDSLASRGSIHASVQDTLTRTAGLN